jgi:hypothetical protein
MNCATHEGAEAIGICCNCGRGVCAKCYGSGQRGKVACSPECESAIVTRDRALSNILTRSTRSNRAAGCFSVAGGSVFLLLGVYHAMFAPHGPLMALCFGLGATLMISGIALIRIAQTKQ